MIFVSIAAYRDPQLAATIRDCLEKARHPEQLHFCICWQHADDERLPSWCSDGQFTIVEIPFEQSRGLCWARSVIMDLWDGEEWYLQLDSHHRFAHDWDVQLLAQARQTGSQKPLLSTFGTSFSPDSDDGMPHRPTRIEFNGFRAEGDIVERGGWITGDSTRPIRARFVSAHFLFAPGSFVADVAYDPDLYYLGEETAIALRAFTHGYDLFHPGVPILSHEYTRANRPKHWNDHLRSKGIAVQWNDRDAISRARIKHLLGDAPVGGFGLGTERTLEDYEQYAGISFKARRVQEYTLRNLEPPNPARSQDWIQV